MISILKLQDTLTKKIAQESVATLTKKLFFNFFPTLPDRDNSLKLTQSTNSYSKIQPTNSYDKITQEFQLSIGENSETIQILNNYIFLLKLNKEFHLEKKQIITYGENTESTLQTKNVSVYSSSPNTQNRENISSVPQIQALKVTQERLIELLKEDEEDEYGILKPTPYAFDKAWGLTLNASQFLKNNFRKASVCTDDEGGIRLTWSKVEAEAEVRLICPSEPHKEIYLYHEKGLEYYVVKDVTAFTLASWLDWLNKV